VISVLVSTTRAQDDDFDVRPVVVDGKLTTNGFSDGTSAFQLGSRVFAYSFQESDADPFFTSDPGFNASSTSGIPGGTNVAFDIVDAAQFGLPSDLSYWDGSDADPLTPGVQVKFTAPPHQEKVNFSFGALSVDVGNTLPDIPGFVLQTVLSNGSMH